LVRQGFAISHAFHIVGALKALGEDHKKSWLGNNEQLK
jgi:hypothetical protein